MSAWLRTPPRHPARQRPWSCVPGALRLGLALGIVGLGVATLASDAITVDDRDGGLGDTGAGLGVSTTRLSRRQVTAAREGRLGLVEVMPVREKRGAAPTVLPVQWAGAVTREAGRGVWQMPVQAAGARRFTWREVRTLFPAVMDVTRHPVTGQLELRESGKPVLQYNDRTIEPGSVLDQVSEGNRIYARARSDYIHPLYGLEGEVLTKDWSLDHPHHRGIYWAWPEVDYGAERGDLHALQRVFARPTGRGIRAQGPVYAQVEVENLWRWEDREPVVREVALIRAYRRTATGRVIDLAFKFEALKDGVSVARRGTDAYGGLNVRMATPQGQTILTHTDAAGVVPRRAWSDLSGQFEGAVGASGLTLFQHPGNPAYPGDWVQYPQLSWCQPTFPAAKTRHALAPGQALILRYRLWVHAGPQPDGEMVARWWTAWEHGETVLPEFSSGELPRWDPPTPTR